MSQPREEREVFTALIQTHGHAMYRAARALLPSDTAAEDAVGEAVLLAWQAFPKLKRREAARAWLLKITVNCAYGQFRRERPTLPLEEAAVQTAPGPVGAGPDPAPRPAAGRHPVLLRRAVRGGDRSGRRCPSRYDKIPPVPGPGQAGFCLLYTSPSPRD